MALRELKSVQMGWYLAELVLKCKGNVHVTDFVINHQGAQFIKWLKHKNELIYRAHMPQTELLLIMFLSKLVPWVKRVEKPAQYFNF